MGLRCIRLVHVGSAQHVDITDDSCLPTTSVLHDVALLLVDHSHPWQGAIALAIDGVLGKEAGWNWEEAQTKDFLGEDQSIGLTSMR